VVAGAGAWAVCDGERGTTGTGRCELGSAGTAVCLRAEPSATTRAMTNAVTSSTAAAAATHSQRGALGFSGSGCRAWFGGG
jgi:hypothetical protein